jgi:hypothetical protein
MVSYSFADGFYGKLAQRASDMGLEAPIAIALNDDVREQVQESLSDRGIALREQLPAPA